MWIIIKTTCFDKTLQGLSIGVRIVISGWNFFYLFCSQGGTLTKKIEKFYFFQSIVWIITILPIYITSKKSELQKLKWIKKDLLSFLRAIIARSPLLMRIESSTYIKNIPGPLCPPSIILPRRKTTALVYWIKKV